MILTCPACATRYLLAEEALGPEGRAVRCARCKHQWHQGPPPGDDRAPAEPPPARVRPIPPGSNLPAIRKRRSGAGGWLLFLLVLAGLIAGLWLGRAAIVAAYPPAARLYQAVGLDEAAAARAGLELRNLQSSRAVEGGTTVLLVSGEVANIAEVPRQVPPIRVGLRDAERREIHEWTFRIEAAELAPGQVAPFASRLERPPAAARELDVSFAPPAR